MSDQITKPVVRWYGNIFGVPRSGPRMVELEVPVTPVLDVSRGADLGSGIGRSDGWCSIDTSNVHAAPGTITTTTDLLAALKAALGDLFDPPQHLPWLFETTVFSATTAIITSAFARTGEETQEKNFSRLFARWTGALVDSGADTAIPVFGARQIAVPMYGNLFNYTQTSVSAGIGTIVFRHLVWIGSRGARPPFVA